MKQRGYRYCSTCHSKLQKWGTTKAGTQRWRCPSCTDTATKPRTDLRKALILERFVTWLLGKQSQAELGVSSDRTWRRQIAWCWQIIPRPVLTGEVYSVLLIDATQVGSLVCHVVRSPEAVTNWSWAGWESSYTWEVVLKQLPAPLVVVCDGQKGILLALARCWPEARIQRCLFHVWQNLKTKLTLHPQTLAGQELLALYRHIWKVQTVAQAEAWQEQFQVLFERYEGFLKQRTYLHDPAPNQRKWWYTHRGVRSAYRQIAQLLRDDQLFTYLDEDLLNRIKAPIPRTTNHVEGGINSQLKEKLKLHRGLTQVHQQRLVDWYLYSRTKDQKPTRNVR